MTTAGLKLEVRVAWWLKPAVRWLIFKARVLNAIGRLDEARLADLMDQGERLAKRAIGVRDWRRVRPWYVIGFASLFSPVARPWGMNRIHLTVLLILAAIGALLFALPVVLVGGPSFATAAARAATPPSFSVADGTWMEGGAFAPTATKSAAAGSYSKITFTVSAGTCSSSRFIAPPPLTVTVGNKQIIVPGPVVKTIDNSIADGDCTIIVRITAVRFATIARSTATWTVKDNDVAPPAFDPETVASWVPAPAVPPLSVGSYAFLTSGGPCCKGLIVRILAAGLTGDVDPARRVNIYTVQYAADPSGNYPAASPYWRALVDFNYDAGLQGVVPAP